MIATRDIAVRDDGHATTPTVPATVLEKTLIGGDLAQLTPAERVVYYLRVCDTLGLNPLTKPFDYLALKQDGVEKLILYANRTCADQLRNRDKVDIKIVARELLEDVYVVTARASLPDGRGDEAIGAVTLSKEDGEWRDSHNGKRYFAGNGTFVPLRGDARANAIMRAETKAKRRVTLSICGLGWIDESEVESIESARRVVVDAATGEIAEPAPPFAKPPAAPDSRPASRGTDPRPKGERPVNRDEAEKHYRALCDTADGVGVPAESWDAKWADVEVLAKYRDLKARVATRETEMAEAARQADLFPEEVGP